MRALFELRTIIEPAAAALAVERSGEGHLGRMADALAGMERHGLADPAGQIDDQRFHAKLLAATGNELLTSFSGGIAAAMRWTTFYKHQVSARPRDPIPQHRALLRAIADGDPAAARSTAADLIDRARVDTKETLDC